MWVGVVQGGWKVGLGDVPDDFVVDLGVAVYEDVADGDG